MNQHFVLQQLGTVRPWDDSARVAEYLFDTCWPGGGSDRTIQAAQAWVTDWRPEGFAIELAACRCASGRCRICN